MTYDIFTCWWRGILSSCFASRILRMQRIGKELSIWRKSPQFHIHWEGKEGRLLCNLLYYERCCSWNTNFLPEATKWSTSFCQPSGTSFIYCGPPWEITCCANGHAKVCTCLRKEVYASLHVGYSTGIESTVIGKRKISNRETIIFYLVF